MIQRKILAAVCLIALLISGCAGRPDVPPYSDIRELDEGLELITGRDSTGRVAWMGLRSRTSVSSLQLTLSRPAYDGPHLVSTHPEAAFQDMAVRAGMTGSPHDPIRLSSGRHQDVVGFYRINGKTINPPDDRHDAVGIAPDRRPRLLKPADQVGWNGDGMSGFFAILEGGNPGKPVSVRDAVSAIGWSDDGDILIMMVSRGRDGIGLSYREAGRLMRRLGADDALAMDGGGSARLIWREGAELHSYPTGRVSRALPNRLLLSLRD